jgi:purine-nucleoside phosphorylase
MRRVLNERETNMDGTIALQFEFRIALCRACVGNNLRDPYLRDPYLRDPIFARTTMSISDDFTQAEFAAKHIFSKSPIKPTVAIVLGSGLGGFADEMTEAVRISYNDIPHFARSTAVGHAGQLVMGNIGECPVVVMQGRVHLYEGYPVRSVVFPMRVFARMGVRAAILTNAAGGINPEYGQGRLVAIRDHINLQGQNPLVGPEDPKLGLP